MKFYMMWNDFDVNDEKTYPPQDELVVISYKTDKGSFTSVAILKCSQDFGGYYWLDILGHNYTSLLKNDQHPVYKPSLNVYAWMEFPMPHGYECVGEE